MPEERTPQPHERRALFDGERKIIAHSHREVGQFNPDTPGVLSVSWATHPGERKTVCLSLTVSISLSNAGLQPSQPQQTTSTQDSEQLRRFLCETLEARLLSSLTGLVARLSLQP